MKHKFNDYGSIKSNVLTPYMRLNKNAIPIDSIDGYGSSVRLTSGLGNVCPPFNLSITPRGA